MSLKLFLKNMSKASNVELLNFYSLVEVPFKYAHKEVLFYISILYFNGKTKSYVHYHKFEDEELQTVLGYVVSESLAWTFGSLKTDKFTVNQNFIFNTVQEVEKSLKEQINAVYKSTGINAKFSMQYALKDKPSAENNDLLEKIFAIDKMLPFAFTFNINGGYEVALKECSLKPIHDIGFFA